MRAAGSLLLVLLILALSPRADACGIAGSHGGTPANNPGVTQDDALIVYDGRTGTEQLVRRVRFDKAERAFGYIVPVPSRPEVHDAPDALWARLRSQCPPELGVTPGATGTGPGFGKPSARDGGVTELEQKKLGSFTAFVLAASDTKALDAWLHKNGFDVTGATRAWLGSYVRLGFYYVALRYDAAAGSSHELSSKTVRLTFTTPSPYFPYSEPAGTRDEPARQLVVWVAGSMPMLPVAGVEVGGKRVVRRPWTETRPCTDTASGILHPGIVGKELAETLPPGAHMQAFADLKTNRRGWGDVLLAPLEAQDCDEACVKQRLRLLPLLDPDVARAPEVAPATLAIHHAAAHAAPPRAPAPARPAPSAAPSRKPGGCSASRGEPSSPGVPIVFAALALLAVWRRRRAGLALSSAAVLLVACRGSHSSRASPASSAAGPSDSAHVPLISNTSRETPFELPKAPAAAPSTLLELLAGHRNGQLIEVWSRPEHGGLGAIELPRADQLVPRATMQRLCVPDDRVEGVARYLVDGSERRADVEGAFSPAIIDCVRRNLLEATLARHEKYHVETGSYGFGKLDKSLAPFRQRVNALGLPPNAGPPIPPPHVTKLHMLAFTVKGALPEEVVQRIVRQHYGQYRACYEKARAKGPVGAGRVVAHFVIGPHGAVASSSNSGSDLPNPGVVQCVVQALRTVSFPKPEHGSVDVHVAISFSHG